MPLVCALAVAMSAVRAMAQTACGTAHALPAPFPRPNIVDQGLAVALRAEDLAMWPQDGDMQINSDAGIVLHFNRGASCELAVTSAMEHGLRIALPPAGITAIDVALCDVNAGMCVPIRVRLSE